MSVPENAVLKSIQAIRSANRLAALGIGANNPVLEATRLAASSELQKTIAQLSKPLGASFTGVFPASNELQKTITQLSKPLGASFEDLFPAAGLTKQTKALTALETSRAGLLASSGLAAQIKLTEERSLYKRASLVGLGRAQGTHLRTEMTRNFGLHHPMHSLSLYERLLPRDEMSALTRGIVSDFLPTSFQHLGVSALGAQALALPKFSFPNVFGEALEESQRIIAAVERFVKRWEQNALWFMLSSLAMRQIYRFVEMDGQEIEDALLEALDAVVTEGVYTQALISALDKAPYITDGQRDDLQHGLEHAERGEFARAVPPLMYGLEGALWSTARGHTLVDDERRLIDKPQKGPVRKVELVVRRLPGDKEYATFVCARVFGNVGNPVRHGEESGRRRRHALFAVVATAGWLDAFMDVPAREVLGQMLREQLSS